MPGMGNASIFWLWFIPAALLTFWFAFKMVKFAEVIIAKTKFGGAFVGGALISVSTSLTELTTEIIQSSIGKPAVALADDLGANYFSTFAIAVMSLVFIKQMFVKKLGNWTKASIFLSAFLSILASILLGFQKDIGIGKQGAFIIGIVPIFFFLAYLIYVWLSYKFGAEDEEATHIPPLTARQGVIGFLIYSLLLLGAAFFLNITVHGMQATYGLKPNSAGGILLSLTTAMPEVVSLFILLYNKRPIAAVGSIIGSQVFNLSQMLYGDMVYTKSPIVNASAEVWKMGVATSVMLLLLGIFAIISKKIKNKVIFAIFPILIILTYIIGWILILTI